MILDKEIYIIDDFIDLEYQEDVQELICRLDKLAYPIRDDIPIMLPTEARQLRDSEG